MPKISTVTICYNDAKALASTLISVTAQTHTDLEVIVQDGGSTDDTASVVAGFGDWVSHYEVKKDNGIYQAMNNAVAHCTGDFTVFMNAADKFESNVIAAEVAGQLLGDDDIVFGQAISCETGKVHNYRPQEQYWCGMVMDHQATFVRTQILKDLGFDESLKISGDYDFFSRARLEGYSFRKIEMNIARKPFSYGLSSSFIDRTRERAYVAEKYFGAQYDVLGLIRREVSVHIRRSFGDVMPQEELQNMPLDELFETYDTLQAVTK